MAKVTVLMPTYNVASYVKAAIDSVLNQTYSDFELLVIDDCSTDDTVEEVRKIEDPRIRIVQNERNLGLAENLNRGLSLITTEYVARMDGDDIALPHWLESEITFLEAHPEVGVCGGGGVRFGTMNSTIRFSEWHDDIVANMLFHCTIIVPTFRMSLYRDHSLRYRADAFPAEDYRFWADCLRVTQLHNIPDTLFRYRMHTTQICTAKREEQKLKVAEVQKYMLHCLGGKVTPTDEDYFTDKYQRPVSSLSDWRQRRRFTRRLLKLNDGGSLSNESLRHRLHIHLQQTLYYTVTERYFSHGYSIKAYFRYLFSGLALHTGWHYELRFLAKSILHRPE